MQTTPNSCAIHLLLLFYDSITGVTKARLRLEGQRGAPMKLQASGFRALILPSSKALPYIIFTNDKLSRALTSLPRL
jgi:hypothetical protein